MRGTRELVHNGDTVGINHQSTALGESARQCNTCLTAFDHYRVVVIDLGVCTTRDPVTPAGQTVFEYLSPLIATKCPAMGAGYGSLTFEHIEITANGDFRYRKKLR